MLSRNLRLQNILKLQELLVILEEINNNKIKMYRSITQTQITGIKVFNHLQATQKIYQVQSLILRQEDQEQLVTHRQSL